LPETAAEDHTSKVSCHFSAGRRLGAQFHCERARRDARCTAFAALFKRIFPPLSGFRFFRHIILLNFICMMGDLSPRTTPLFCFGFPFQPDKHFFYATDDRSQSWIASIAFFHDYGILEATVHGYDMMRRLILKAGTIYKHITGPAARTVRTRPDPERGS
jgi:hypothetical protein